MPTTSRGTIGNLPAEVTSFVGRGRELGEVKRLLGESRLVTLAGAGGTGKTRLSLRVGAELRRAFSDGVWFVDLTQLHEPELLAPNVRDPDVLAFLVTATLGLCDQGGGPPLRGLAEQLADLQVLLILDNCEHLIPTSAIVVDALLRGCAGLRILATSREPLGIAGETLYPVPPLPAPDPGHLPSRAELSGYEAVALFLARAQAVAPGFSLTDTNQVAVAELCHRLDGLPLAIELAAARVRALAPAQILERLADRFAVLSRGSRAAPQRQQTLRACVDWSFDLCAKPERVLWGRLSVFAGGFELDSVEEVCADEHLPEADLLDLVADLVDKSILICDNVRDGQGEHARYRMLETIRDYGGDKLREAGKDAVLRRRHRDWHQQLVAHARAEWVSGRQTYWMARLTREQANLRAALEFCLTETGEAQAALRLAVTLPRFYWRAGGLIGEGRRWLDRALAQATAATALRAQALLVNSQLAFWQGDAAAGTWLLNEGEELARRRGADAELAHAAFIQGVGAVFANDLPVAVESLHRAWAAMSQAPHLDLDLYLNVLLTSATAAALAGDHEWVIACQREMLAIVEPRGEGIYRSLALWLGGFIAWRGGDLRQAAAQQMESLRLKRARGLNDRFGTTLCLEVLAWITANQLCHRRAAVLLGAAETLCTETGAPISAYLWLVDYHDACERQTRDALGDAAFTDAFQHGQALTYDDAVAYAIEEPARESAPILRQATSAPLTRREQQVAGLIAQGLSNKDIAAALVISPRTAETHVEHILTKLSFTSRAQVATWVAARSNNQDS